MYSSPTSRGRELALASITPGLEDLLAEELAELGIRSESTEGGVEFSAQADALYAVHLYSRLAARVTVRVGTFRAKSLQGLADGVNGLDWSKYIWPRQKVTVRATLHRSALRVRESVEKKVERAIGDRVGMSRAKGWTRPTQTALVIVRIVSNEVTISVDASGDLLHRRGWRKATAKAPIRENLAAAMLFASDWTPGEPLIDPMCGSGTLPIEAATIAMGLLPGMDRSFAFEHWPSHDKKIWMALKEEGRTQKLGADPGVVFMGTDRDKGAIQAASSNAQRAHVAQQTQFRICDFQDLTPPVDAGLVIVNPPYGKRVGGSDPKRIFRTIGQTLQGRWQGWRVAMLIPERRWMGLLGADVEEIASFSNGGVRVHLVCGRVR